MSENAQYETTIPAPVTTETPSPPTPAPVPESVQTVPATQPVESSSTETEIGTATAAPIGPAAPPSSVAPTTTVTHTTPVPEAPKRADAYNVYQNEAANLIVNYLPNTYTDETMMTIFEPYGKIVSCKVIRDHNGTSLGYGFVMFETKDQGEAAINATNGMFIYIYIDRYFTLFPHPLI